MVLFLAAASLAPGQEAEVVVETQEVTTSFLNLLRKGGPVMWPLGICSILGLTMVFERAISLRRGRVAPNFLPGLFETFDGGAGTEGNGIGVCERGGGAAGEAIRSGVRALADGRGIDHANEAIADTGGRVADRLTRSLNGIKTIAQLSPLLGLLGTVYGMIGAFQMLAEGTGDSSKSEKLANGIYEALVTTATGLTIAIPLIVAYFLLRRNLENGIERMDVLREDFVHHYSRPGKAAPSPAPSSPEPPQAPPTQQVVRYPTAP